MGKGPATREPLPYGSPQSDGGDPAPALWGLLRKRDWPLCLSQHFCSRKRQTRQRNEQVLGANGRQFQPGPGKGPEGLSRMGRESSSDGKDRLGASSLDGGQTELESRMGEKRGGDAAETNQGLRPGVRVLRDYNKQKLASRKPSLTYFFHF